MQNVLFYEFYLNKNFRKKKVKISVQVSVFVVVSCTVRVGGSQFPV